ncbi:MAG: Flagellar M-ring protein [Ignavibacteria bacterium]|nr:Flagellar M-ring protein [Ignavibacteria bacterium]
MAKLQMVEELKQFWNKISKTQRTIIIGVSVGVFILLTIFLVIPSSPDLVVLFSNLEEQDAAKIVTKLKEKNVKYDVKDNGTTVLVEKDKVSELRLSIAAEGGLESGALGYELFDKTNLGMSEFVQKLNFRRALEGELARTIGSMDEVKKCRVHIVIPDKALFEKDQKIPTASVTLKLKSGRSLSKISIEGIQNLVAGSIEGMQPQHVTIVDQRGKIISPPPLDEKSIAGLTSIQYDQQRKVEQYLASKAQSMMDGVLGPGNSEVRVNAELNFDQIETTTTDFDPEKQIERSEQEIVESTKSTDSLSYPAVSLDKNQSNKIKNYEISKSVEKIVKSVGTIKRLSVSALINSKVKVTDKEGVKSLEALPRKKEDITMLQDIIRNAVGYDPSRNDQVSVYEFAFDTTLLHEDIDEVLKGPWWKDPENQSIFILLGAMGFTIYLMFRILRSSEIKDRIRLAFGLPEKVIVEDDEMKEEEELEELDFDEEFLLMPSELPEQLLLEGERERDMDVGMLEEPEEEEVMFDKEALASQARAKLDELEAGEMTEEKMMKIEIKNKVQSFIESNTEDAVRLIRLFIAQDSDDRSFKL